MRSRGFSIVVISANGAGAVYYLLQGRLGLALLLAVVAGFLAWLAFRSPSRSTTFRPVRSLTAGAVLFGAATLLMALGVSAAEEGDPRALGVAGAAVGAALTAAMLWAVVRARRMGYGWSSEVAKRQPPDDNPRGAR